MKLFGKNLDNEVAIVAEIGVNHEGDPGAALNMIRLAATAGADAVKFQTFTPERYASASDPERLARVRGFCLDADAHHRLAAAAAALDITFFSTAVSDDVIPLIAELAPVIKIASGDLTFEPVIRAAAATGKPVIVSTGAGTVDEVDQAVAWVSDEIGGAPLAERLVLMQCVSAYPTAIEDANVRGVVYLAERYGVTVGYSNHVAGIDACLAATALGAAVIEVHFTDCKTGRAFRDHALSCDPDDLAALVRMAPRVRASLGSAGKAPTADEMATRDMLRKGVVAAKPLAAGQFLTREDLMYARPATEFPASALPTLVGRVLNRSLVTGETVARADVKDG